MSSGIYVVSIEDKVSKEVTQSWDFYTEEAAMDKYRQLKQEDNTVIATVTQITFGKEEDAR